MDYCYSHEISQQTIYNMDLILFTKLVRDDAFESESESNSVVWSLYTNMAYQTRKSKNLEQLMHH